MPATRARARIVLESVESKVIAAYGYDAATRTLAIQFRSTGDIWHYAPIGGETAICFACAESKGRYFSRYIKGQGPSERMTGPCPKCGDIGWIGDACEDCGTALYAAPPPQEGTP